ncbi:MAG: transglycosylase SLT domain-containing protein [Myxococcota bacterium]
MLLRAKRTAVWGLFASLILATPLVAYGNDLGDAVDFAQKHFDRRTRDDFEPQWQKRSRHEALGMLSSRDVDEEKALGAYDCLDSAIDTMPIMRSSGKEKAALRGCLKHRFERSHLPGYRTLGTVRLDEVHVRPMIESEAAKHEVPAIVLNTIIMLVSGFRPHAVSEQGHLGLMQLRPDLLAAEGITHDDLLEPGENIRAGAAYVRALVFKYGGLRKAMLAYADGGIDMTYKSRSKRWFVDNTMSIYYGSDRKFPYKLGAENIKFVWTWLE